MKKLLAIFTILVFNAYSFGYFLNAENPVDKCCIINVLDWKNQLPIVEKKLKLRYLKIYEREKQLIWKLESAFWENPKYYAKLINQIVDYAYQNNVYPGTKLYLVLSYLAFSLYKDYQMYSTENNPVIEHILYYLNK